MSVLEKPVPKRVLLIATVASLLIIFVLASNAWAPRLSLPPEVISGVTVVEASGVHDWKELSLRNRFLLERASRQVGELTPFLASIGPFIHPVTLEIDSVSPLRFEVSSDHLVIGTDILQARGQLARSLMKIWTLQNADPRAIPSALRYEVAADLLTAFFQGRLTLEDPISHARVEFPRVGDSNSGEWTDLLLPLDRFCQTAWRPLELLSLCQMTKESAGFMATPMMARPLIGALVWESYQKLSMRARPDFIRAFADAIKSPNAAAAVSGESAFPRLPTEWRLFIEHEARRLTPTETAPASRLPEVGRLTIERTDNLVALVPSGLGLQPGDVVGMSVKTLIWQSCQQPTIAEVLSFAAQSKRILYVHHCGTEVIDYDVYERHGLEAFAAIYPKLSFVALHEDSLKLARDKGLTNQFDLIKWVLNFDHRTASRAADTYFGLSKPHWRREIGAYQVDGAIEAVEWFRPAPTVHDTL